MTRPRRSMRWSPGRAILAIGVTLLAGAALIVFLLPSRGASSAAQEQSGQKTIALAARQGEAYGRAVAWERAGAAWSREVLTGGMHIAIALSPAEGACARRGDDSIWIEPEAHSVHIRVFVADPGDGRFVPALSVRLRAYDKMERSLAGFDLPFALYPLTDAYGANVRLPGDTAKLALYVESSQGWLGFTDRFDSKVRIELPFAPPDTLGEDSATARAEQAPPALARDQIEAFEAALVYLRENAPASAMSRSGDVELCHIVERSESRILGSWWDGEPRTKGTAQLSIIPRDIRTGRFRPDLRLSATVQIDGTAHSLTGSLPFRWHGWLYHYGESWPIPPQSDYRITLKTAAPALRYGRNNKPGESPADLLITSDAADRRL